MRSERLLRGMHQVVSHDLPNQLLAVNAALGLAPSSGDEVRFSMLIPNQ